MKKVTTLTILLTALTAVAFGQITTTKVAPKTDLIDNTPYDSIQNFLGNDVYKYKGQELYLKGKAESLRKYGYDNFVIDYTKDKLTNKSNVYKCCDSYNSKYDELAGKYFKVLDIIKHPKSEQSEYLYGKKFYFKLQEKESNDIVYYEYDSQFEHSFPFIVVGFFEKQKNLVVGKEFVFADKVLESSADIQTGKTVTTKTGQKWKCTDLTIEEKYFTLSLVIENSLGETTTISHESVFGKWSYGRAYTATEAENYRKKFGQENFDRILQGKVKIGMTKEMCKLSWGEPKSINETITSGKKSEQWVYSDNYLYFDNGILTAIQ
ncbi:MAG TPA: hypothetical protein PKD45_08865 [Flavobacteriales bacterium]|nr:hypothetical protein [Flavobacteriales bacterium]